MVRAKKMTEQEARKSEKLKAQEEERRKALTDSVTAVPRVKKALRLKLHPVHELVGKPGSSFAMKSATVMPTVLDLEAPYVLTGMQDEDFAQLRLSWRTLRPASTRVISRQPTCPCAL